MIRTKILATIGPACSTVDMLHKLFESGVDTCRLNFSHGSIEQHAQTLKNIRDAAARWKEPIAVLGDLCGPKIRLGEIKDIGGTGGMQIDEGGELIIQRAPIVGESGRASSTYPNLVDDVKVGNRMLIEDGLLRFMCVEKGKDEICCRCTTGGTLKSHKGINLPNTRVNLPSITERDWECVNWAIENELDYLALSFVRSVADIEQLREHLRDRVSDIHIIAKIEKAEALADIDAIVEASDGLMIARGDLGVEIDLARVPLVQKDLIARCQIASKPVIVATQMLQSMVEQSSPTRAEVSDVANAIFDGTDAVMLSGETAVGKFPVASVVVMSHIAEVTEDFLAQTNPHGGAVDFELKLKSLAMSAAIAKGVNEIASELKVKLVAVYSQTGSTARVFSKCRFTVPIIGLSSDHRSLRRMALHYGVIPVEMPPPDDAGTLVKRVDQMVQQRQFATVGERVVIVAGTSLGTPGTMNAIVMHTVGEA